MKIKLIAFNGRYIHSCLALFYVREELRKNVLQAEIELHQFTINDPYYETLLTIGEGDPEAIFFSTYIWSSELIIRTVSDLLQIMPQTIIVLGGPQASLVASELNREQVCVVKGEIEGVSSSFYRDLESGSLQGEYLCDSGRPFPSPYTDMDLSGELKNRHIYYESSRGCPFHCSYCLSSVNRGVTWKELEQVKKELTGILSQKPKIIKFVDRTFNARLERSIEIWRFLAAQNTGTVFHFEMAPDRFTEEMFDLLGKVRPGLFQFELGIQTTNNKTLVAINREMNVVAASENISRLAGMGNIHLHVDLILGLPEETLESYGKALNDVFSMKAHYIQMGLLKVLPETAISKTPGLISCSKPPYQVLRNREMDHETISHLYRFGECVEAFHNNRYFTSFFSHLRERNENISRFFTDLLKLCLMKDFFSLSHTQEMLTGILVEFILGRRDKELLKELLLFDWLRCGHRFLPQNLNDQDLNKLRKKLSAGMAQNLLPFYDHRIRSEFFKKSMFARFSGDALNRAGLSDGRADGIVCFLPDLDKSIHSYQKTALLPQPYNKLK